MGSGVGVGSGVAVGMAVADGVGVAVGGAAAAEQLIARTANPTAAQAVICFLPPSIRLDIHMLVLLSPAMIYQDNIGGWTETEEETC